MANQAKSFRGSKPRLKVVPTSHPETERLIRTDFYRRLEIVKVNRGRWPLNGAKQVFEHLRTNKYEATHAEVYNEGNGKLYAVLKRDMDGNVRTLFESKYKPSELPPPREPKK
jgi:hypothetical protein